MNSCFSEPTIDDLMHDSLTQGLMRADGVNPSELKEMLVGMAALIVNRPSVQPDYSTIPAPDFWASHRSHTRQCVEPC